MSASENVELYRRVIEEGFSKGDLTVIDEVLSPDFVEYEIVPGQAPGRQGVKDIVTMMRTAFPDLHLTLQDAITSGDQLCGRLTFSGTNTGPFMGQPPTGRAASWGAIDIVRFRDGRIAEHWGEMDMLGLLGQLGAVDLQAAA